MGKHTKNDFQFFLFFLFFVLFFLEILDLLLCNGSLMPILIKQSTILQKKDKNFIYRLLWQSCKNLQLSNTFLSFMEEIWKGNFFICNARKVVGKNNTGFSGNRNHEKLCAKMSCSE